MHHSFIQLWECENDTTVDVSYSLLYFPHMKYKGVLVYMIFLYRFDVKENDIHFVLNEQIAADMLPQYDVLLRPLVTSLAETLQLYCSLSKQPTLLTSKIQDSGEIEVMLNQELGQCIDGYIKDRIILKNGKRIADILMEIRNAHTIYH